MQTVLSKSQLFSHLDKRSLEEIGSAATMRAVSKSEVIFHEGDIAQAFFIVASGKVKIFKLSADGKEQILMIASAGQSFAEAALFSGGRYPASAQALEDSELLVINRDGFVRVLGRNPDLAVNLIARLSELLRKMTSLVEELSLTDVTTRLAHRILSMIDDHDSRPRPIVSLAEKKTVLASQLGTIPETLSRSFARLSREKIIAIEGSRIEILDLKKLRELAGEF
ncbi:Crp/Fnr family transcriptional regulator [candidate division GN15 bacterium]|uniref:Crp/Fnr family transcriptional regulator n=1 Tax=candidate division GN15 bacterium TaxID=2072418 RepID=A0A855X4L3_9BACT|nr:MAG: Crp/Fnr family transcriptional regulator [candidate division GN15 bacterium]